MKIKALLFVVVALIMMTVPVVSVFANDVCVIEHQWEVTVRWQSARHTTQTTTFTIWAATAREAETRGEQLASGEFGHHPDFRILSAIARRAT